MSAPAGDSRTYSLDSAAGGVSVPRLLFAFLRQRFTGTVSVGQRSPAGQRTIWVRGGMPVFCDWDSPADHLGDMLVAAGVIDVNTLARALTTSADSGRLLGQVLIEFGALDAAGRTTALREQCSRKLTRLFAADATSGEAIVTAVEHGKGNGDELAQVNVLGLLFAGVTAHYDEARIRAEIGPPLDGDLVATPALARYERQFGFGPSDTTVLQALARGVTVSRLMTPGVDPTRALAVVYTLWVSQMLRLGDDAVQAIAKGATAAAAAVEAGVTIGTQFDAKPSPPPKAAAKPPPPPPKTTAAKPPPPPPAKTTAAKPPSKPPPPEPAPDDGFEAKLAVLEAKVAAEANAFTLFGLELSAERPEVRAAWAELSKTFHPDALEGAGRGHLRSRVEPVFAALSEAYGVLSDKDARQKLRDAIEFAGQDLKANEDTSAVVRNAFEAEMLARDADKLLRAKQWDKALELYVRAYELSPQDGDIEAALHYTRFRAGPGTETDALTTIAALDKLTTEQPILARAYYFAGLIQLSIDETSAAKRSFLKASQLDPRNVDAERQLRAIKLREQASNASKDDKKKSSFGALRGLFKKD